MPHNSYENFPTPEVYKFKLREREKDRYITAVRGLPFYCSSGKYSKNPGTWFVCRGISEGKWIRKSRLTDSSDFQSFCVQQTICLKHLKSRLGSTVEAVCISASLGGGFWETKNGLLAKKFLFENYSHYFLPDETVKEILIAKEKAEKEKHSLSSPDEVNTKLIELGVFLPLDNHYNRLPSDEERKFLFNAATYNDKKMMSVLSVILNTEQTIDKLTFDSVLELAQSPLLIDYALKSHLFENKEQVTAFNELMSNKKEITQEVLKNILILKNVVLPDEYKFFLENHACRKALRIIGKKDERNSGLVFDPLELDLINELHEQNLLYIHVKILKNLSIKTALKTLFKNKLINKSNVKMVKKLDKKKQLRYCQQLLYHPESYPKLKNLCTQKMICIEEIKKIIYSIDKEKKLAPPPQPLYKKSFVKYSVFNENVEREDIKKNKKNLNSVKDPSSSPLQRSESVPDRSHVTLLK